MLHPLEDGDQGKGLDTSEKDHRQIILILILDLIFLEQPIAGSIIGEMMMNLSSSSV